MSTSLVWLRDDLRLADNPALDAAARSGGRTAVLYVLDDESPEVRPLGAASRWWLHHSLRQLQQDLEARGGSLILRRGPTRDVLPAVVTEVSATSVHWNRRYGSARAIDTELKVSLPDARSYTGSLLHDPWSVTTGAGTPFKVFTPFWKSILAGTEPRLPLFAPASIAGVKAASDSLDSWNLLPDRTWASDFPDKWTPGEAGARERLERFLDNGLALYHRRDEPGIESTSGLSPHLRFGEISPYQVWHAVESVVTPTTRANASRFLSEIGWREFSYHQLFHNTDIHRRNLRAEFDEFPWEKPNATHLTAWKKGTTGIELVDAGMRELWKIGTMHNRVRMVAASFLIKNLGIDWRIGEAWFWNTLVDADEASNPASWQWVAGSGYDAAPYFRVFNPELQAAKFDPDSLYRARWIDEYNTPLYPEPIVSLSETRARALADYSTMRGERPPQ
ncbi:MAG: deoxyribodipyrimidine photo-lyase [Microbacteriaceae bacterium]|nr:deoxyribodipyrimidine photo-lyase [Microbacteriaceae bacterium]